ncbi:STAS domain-containing protein [Dactylosporangium aurantiacum]|uniref:STAS domain-containing protein n=1 Tax=Dactylosporangium aurantiacum TaxID=35754 RepID=A0A9Q9I820_9ACTN|nr:STAS domain-containing protein [Dactylosporangium aurantiacum]MDG6110484.1 STAS domain-containing protein [Dactylosporangium aurantiacum]UWZ51032.1 STAS domain-containing protein [Dactylosporangium aurantiacum]
MRPATPTTTDAIVEIVVTDTLDENSVRRNHRLIENMVEMRPAHCIIDLTACRTVDQSGAAFLVDVHRTIGAGGGQLTLRGLSMHLYQLLQPARMEEILQTAARPSGYRPRHRMLRPRSRQLINERQSEDLRWWRAPATDGAR